MNTIKPKVKLINHTQDARELLLYTKFTRLSNENEDAMDIINSWSEERKQQELDYMLGTIESSWEFLTYTFSISGVDRAFTHQLVRTRGEEKGEVSYAQQSQRTVSMEGFNFTTPNSLINNQDKLKVYLDSMQSINDSYQELINSGVPVQDARGLLPTAIETSIIVKLDLRLLSHMMSERLCTRTQGLYQQVAFMMRELVLQVHPWAEGFLNVFCVNKGICRFENYHKCPIKSIMFDPNTGLLCKDNPEVPYEEKFDARSDKTRPANKSEIKSAWEKMNLNGGYEAIPDMQKK
jgi:thymidylate synthase (FAD)